VKIVTSPRAARYIRDHGGSLWVWLDPHRCLVGAYTYLDAATEPPGSSRKTRFTRASRQPHRFQRLAGDEFELHFDPGRLDLPDELHIDLKGWRNKRVEAYWNGCVFAGEDVPSPSERSAAR
jgi:hypothetical protein